MESLRHNTRAASKSRSVDDAIHKFLEQVKKTDWKSSPDKQALEKAIAGEEKFGCRGDAILHRLILSIKPRGECEAYCSFWADRPADAPGKNDTSESDYRGLGTQFLFWMMRNKKISKFFTGIPMARGGQEKSLKNVPIHLAIFDNKFFLRCLLGLYYHQDVTESMRKLMQSMLEQKRPSGHGNCIHIAIEDQSPFASTFVAVCSDNSLLEKDNEGFTPLHLALMMKPGPKIPIPSPPASFASVVASDKKPCWSDTFSAAQFFQEVQTQKPHKLVEILKMTNNSGESCLQTAYCNLEATDDNFRRSLKSFIFENMETIEDARIALYGVSGRPKELFLNMSDFNQMSHDFQSYVDKMTADIPAGKMAESSRPDVLAQRTESEANGLKTSERDTTTFEETLFFVHLPDLNYVKQPCQHSTIRKLFRWLQLKNVKTIKKLRIPDSTTNPLSEVFVKHYILDVFNIEALDWRKLDINLDILSSSSCLKTLTDLTLYSSGNWSVLYHWISDDGLKKLTNLRSVRIYIIGLNPAKDHHDGSPYGHTYCVPVWGPHHDAETRDLYAKLIERYKEDFESAFKAPGSSIHVEIETDVEWMYPASQVGMEEHETQGVRHKFISELLKSSDVLRQWDNEIDDNGLDVWADERDRFKEYALAPKEPLTEDKRIRVAIIDNGADRIRSKFRHMIAQGNSFVAETEEGSTEPLPWWMVSDPHGTQMASLVSQANRFCRLYIARVGKRRDDIEPDAAAKAVWWAIGLKVDVISISWTMNRKSAALQDAIREATEMHILIFCSTSDQGALSNDTWPVNDNNVISVSATDQYGHLTSQAQGTSPADIQIPGQNVPVRMGTETQSISGSSVATALAAGIASFALLLLRIFNETLPDSGRRGIQRHKYYTKEGMLEVFRRMGDQGKAVMLSKMFPEEFVSAEKFRQSLKKNWCIDNW